ncbi:MAG: PQQ-dependent sugar dehydrogenase [Caldilinea sp.]|nr:PQQ-dependent sugar dehydrogenase [Caldilinea sp.]MCW5845232.1 PQQ-dependent sugar dehydrogenase [Caldilinea sp.]
MVTRLRVFGLVVVALVLIAGCARPAVPDFIAYPVLDGGPNPPILDPNLRGLPNRNIQLISDLAGLQACLDGGASAYGVTLQTTNVRSDATVDACRLGKIARGTLVEITGYTVVKQPLAAANPTPTLALPTPTAVPAPTATPGPQIGYVEDIQPLFNRSCAACHNAAAKTMGLQVTTYKTLMAGSQNGPVVVPGDPDASKLWEMVGSGRMPATGPLPLPEQELVRAWIADGAVERRAPRPQAQVASSAGASRASTGDDDAVESVAENGTWLTVGPDTELAAVSDACDPMPKTPATVVSSDLIVPVSCGVAPNNTDLARIVAQYGIRVAGAAPAASAVAASPAGGAAAAAPDTGEVAAADAEDKTGVSAAAAPQSVLGAGASLSAGAAGIQAGALGLAAASEEDAYMTPRGGFCMQRYLPDNQRGITAIAFAPDGRMFLALDSSLAGDVDPLILYDAYHPSRSVATYDWANNSTKFDEIMVESSRITGMDYADGAVFLSRAGEVGRIPDGGGYEKLADGFAVNSQLFHANNGIVISNGWVYVSAGGMRDGYVEGPIVGVGEAGAQDIVANGNPYAARIVRAPLDALVSQRSIGAFSTAARGVRNPYGITSDPAGRIWFTDNGATNVPDEISAGDEVNMLNPGAIGGDEGSTPYFGFPLALSGTPPDWYSKPVAALVNSAAPTGITWAYGTIFFGEYGRNPGLYRLGSAAGGTVIPERILHGWPILAVTTAPDGALWIGMGDGGLYRVTPGCDN